MPNNPGQVPLRPEGRIVRRCRHGQQLDMDKSGNNNPTELGPSSAFNSSNIQLEPPNTMVCARKLLDGCVRDRCCQVALDADVYFRTTHKYFKAFTKCKEEKEHSDAKLLQNKQLLVGLGEKLKLLQAMFGHDEQKKEALLAENVLLVADKVELQGQLHEQQALSVRLQVEIDRLRTSTEQKEVNSNEEHGDQEKEEDEEATDKEKKESTDEEEEDEEATDKEKKESTDEEEEDEEATDKEKKESTDEEEEDEEATDKEKKESTDEEEEDEEATDKEKKESTDEEEEDEEATDKEKKESTDEEEEDEEATDKEKKESTDEEEEDEEATDKEKKESTDEEEEDEEATDKEKKESTDEEEEDEEATDKEKKESTDEEEEDEEATDKEKKESTDEEEEKEESTDEEKEESTDEEEKEEELMEKNLRTQGKKFKCTECAYRSAHSGNLKLHMRTRDGQNFGSEISDSGKFRVFGRFGFRVSEFEQNFGFCTPKNGIFETWKSLVLV
uniref:C2H2-type domain-containing protein n=1 Tax=Globodera rostochiensis TaxID=31243 RepID=A0A914HJE1_GLORO